VALKVRRDSKESGHGGLTKDEVVYDNPRTHTQQHHDNQLHHQQQTQQRYQQANQKQQYYKQQYQQQQQLLLKQRQEQFDQQQEQHRRRRIWLPSSSEQEQEVEGLVRARVDLAVPPSIAQSEGGVFNASIEDAGRDKAGVWHAQAGQDRTAHKLLKGKVAGYFLDLAANEPVVLSNTRTLERDFGFQGVCIEANPYYWPALVEGRRCQVVGAAVGGRGRGASNNKVKFRAFKSRGQSRNSGIVEGGSSPAQLRSKEGAWFEFEATTAPLAEILVSVNAPKEIDYFSLDIEGAELMVR
jgi:hypothetical protein